MDSGKAHLPVLGCLAFSLAGLSAAVVSQTQAPQAQAPTPEQAAFFETKIRPVFAENCLGCHGKDTQLGGLRLDNLAGFQKGGSSGPLVTPGDPDTSRLVLAVRQTGPLKMPQGGKLKPAEIADIEAWVKMGAPWPNEPSPKHDEKASLWSLEPVKKPAIPKVKNGWWIRNPIDAFVMAKLEANKLSPAPAADRRTLLRRVTYDLTGLPPTPAEVDAFVTDKSPGAYDKVVDRLLHSPAYGERWARQWLDVARYADTKGYVFNEDRNYPNAYTYRDWVIEAINKDLPYDQFIVKQLAADRLPEVQNGDDKRDLAALGFLTVGRRFLNQTPDIIDDRIDVTMRGFEGLTVACARCHDHKFDPIPTQDYYSLYAVFDSSNEAVEPISQKSIREPWEQYNKRVTELEQAIRGVILDQVHMLRVTEGTSEGAKNLSPQVKQALQAVREGELPEAGNLATLKKAFQAAEITHLTDLQSQLDRLKASAPPTPEFAMAMEDKPHPSDGVVFRRGNPGSHGPSAPRRFLVALSKPGEERPHWTQDSGRLELAEAIASKQNPLTARVFVNRIWQGHFGSGIVRTPSDFGHQGEKPTDPALLDYLASTFMDSGWSMRRLHKLIVTSATYCQSSSVSPKTFNVDPDNRLWSRMNRRRLDLEEMRDSVMAAANLLDVSKVGGKSVDLWSSPFTDRRAVYGFIERQNLPGIFRTFDFATPDSTSPKRFVTTVPQQALFFMNSPFVVDEAKALTDRQEIKNSSTDAQRVRRLYRILFDRLPDSEETAAALGFLAPGGETLARPPASPWLYGYGAFDAAQARTASFTPLGYYAPQGYRIGKEFPDPALGYLTLNAQGGHPGHDGAHCAIRRWVAPADMTIQITGKVAHRQKEGDGIRARIVSSRSGLLGDWQVHNSEASAEVREVAVQKGDIIDFLVDPQANDGYDSFSWAPIVRTLDGKQSWDASLGFTPPPVPVTRITLYAQALMMTNEFLFVD